MGGKQILVVRAKKEDTGKNYFPPSGSVIAHNQTRCHYSNNRTVVTASGVKSKRHRSLFGGSFSRAGIFLGYTLAD